MNATILIVIRERTAGHREACIIFGSAVYLQQNRVFYFKGETFLFSCFSYDLNPAGDAIIRTNSTVDRTASNISTSLTYDSKNFIALLKLQNS